jgi:hypothetical protein
MIAGSSTTVGVSTTVGTSTTAGVSTTTCATEFPVIAAAMMSRAPTAKSKNARFIAHPSVLWFKLPGRIRLFLHRPI